MQQVDNEFGDGFTPNKNFSKNELPGKFISVFINGKLLKKIVFSKNYSSFLSFKKKNLLKLILKSLSQNFISHQKK